MSRDAASIYIYDALYLRFIACDSFASTIAAYTLGLMPGAMMADVFEHGADSRRVPASGRMAREMMRLLRAHAIISPWSHTPARRAAIDITRWDAIAHMKLSAISGQRMSGDAHIYILEYAMMPLRRWLYYELIG